MIVRSMAARIPLFVTERYARYLADAIVKVTHKPFYAPARLQRLWLAQGLLDLSTEAKT